MPARDDITYFGAGPASMPTDVLKEAQLALLDYQGGGVGLAEISHRSKQASDIINICKADLAEYLDIPSDYEVLFMQGGGSGGFAATVGNLVGAWVERRRVRIENEAGANVRDVEKIALLRKAVEEELKVDYLVTGSWSSKASQEATRLFGPEYVNIAINAKQSNGGKFGIIPPEKDWKLSKNAAMVYYCDNETVDGVEFPSFPKILEGNGSDNDPIVVADMSSNILSRKIPIKNFSVIFFGAQKNLGTPGVTVVIIKKLLLGNYKDGAKLKETPTPALLRQVGLGGAVVPMILSYPTVAANNSLYNTLSIFDVFIAGRVLKRSLGLYPEDKVAGQEAISDKKAALIYEALDKFPDVYRISPDKSVRSRMNICFRIAETPQTDSSFNELEKKFVEEAESRHGFLGLKGHRSIGGIRASNYNTIPLEGALELVSFINSFAEEVKKSKATA